jgi:hypothetical protein
VERGREPELQAMDIGGFHIATVSDGGRRPSSQKVAS